LYALITLTPDILAQEKETSPFGNRPLKWDLNEDGSHWMRVHTYVQLWARYNQNNPGTLIFEDVEKTTTDLSIRRFRAALQAQLTDKLYIYSQLGINNLNYLSPRGTSMEILDAYAEFEASPAFAIGGGKSSWTGLSRYSSPNTSKMLSYDLVFLALPTNNELDDQIRKLSLYAKGKLSKLDYRLVVAKPFSVRNSPTFDPQPEEGIAKFTDQASSQTYSGYFKWEFLDKEPNKIAFTNGSNLGKRSVLNIGAGVEFQSDRLWHLDNGDTVLNDMVLWSVELFYERPFNTTKNTALTFYVGYFDYDFGPNYIKNIGVNNPGNETNDEASFNGTGNGFPAVGTGTSLFAQAGFLMPRFDSGTQLQPYFSLQYSDFDRLEDPMVYYDIGINWLFHGHLSKLSLNLQNRPIFDDRGNGLESVDRKSMIVLQYIIRIE
jgi:hypothetical protein